MFPCSSLILFLFYQTRISETVGIKQRSISITLAKPEIGMQRYFPAIRAPSKLSLLAKCGKFGTVTKRPRSPERLSRP